MEDSVVVWPVPVTVLAVFGVNVDKAEDVLRETIVGFAEVIFTDTEGTNVDFVKPEKNIKEILFRSVLNTFKTRTLHFL